MKFNKLNVKYAIPKYARKKVILHLLEYELIH